ncbi:MAG TPA: potassium-transporting ATPase subunit KdpA, partial [Chthoniobacteraceae bacterium]|nr:potassium-transporting ATPase subunit KdpA [Chthoniobacteraceae bacterium]
MNAHGWIQLFIYLAGLLLITKPLGTYFYQVLNADGKTFLDPVVKPFEKLTYKLLGVDPKKEQDWKRYTVAMLIFSMLTMLFTYGILRLQDKLPLQTLLNPQGQPAVSEHLAFNTAASFVTNTNWQSYGGESTMSYLSQMLALVIHNFFSPAVGIAVAAVLVRGIARKEASTLGNFWVDLVRITYYVSLPVCLVVAVVLMAMGVPQNFKPYDKEKFSDPFTTQVVKNDASGNPEVDSRGAQVLVDQPITTGTIAQGPIASQIAIKMMGTNGGGYMNTNGAHPFENPSGLCDLFQMIYFIAISAALVYYLGLMVNNRGHGWAVWIAMFVMLLPGILACWHYEAMGNPTISALGINPADGNMEGKEVRFGVFNSALWASTTTATGCGAVNSMHDSFTPIGGLVPLFNIQLGEVVFGGVGSGLYGILVYIAVTVFIAGLMIGRTPEYLGKKVQAYEVKMASFYLLIFAGVILGFTAWGVLSNWGPVSGGAPSNGTNNNGVHGFSEILYAYSEAAGNNGSAFAGLTANAPWYDTTLGIAILFGRYAMMIPVLAIAGSLVRKKASPP